MGIPQLQLLAETLSLAKQHVRTDVHPKLCTLSVHHSSTLWRQCHAMQMQCAALDGLLIPEQHSQQKEGLPVGEAMSPQHSSPSPPPADMPFTNDARVLAMAHHVSQDLAQLQSRMPLDPPFDVDLPSLLRAAADSLDSASGKFSPTCSAASTNISKDHLQSSSPFTAPSPIVQHLSACLAQEEDEGLGVLAAAAMLPALIWMQWQLLVIAYNARLSKQDTQRSPLCWSPPRSRRPASAGTQPPSPLKPMPASPAQASPPAPQLPASGVRSRMEMPLSCPTQFLDKGVCAQCGGECGGRNARGSPPQLEQQQQVSEAEPASGSTAKGGAEVPGEAGEQAHRQTWGSCTGGEAGGPTTNSSSLSPDTTAVAEAAGAAVQAAEADAAGTPSSQVHMPALLSTHREQGGEYGDGGEGAPETCTSSVPGSCSGGGSGLDGRKVQEGGSEESDITAVHDTGLLSGPSGMRPPFSFSHHLQAAPVSGDDGGRGVADESEHSKGRPGSSVGGGDDGGVGALLQLLHRLHKKTQEQQELISKLPQALPRSLSPMLTTSSSTAPASASPTASGHPGCTATAGTHAKQLGAGCDTDSALVHPLEHEVRLRELSMSSHGLSYPGVAGVGDDIKNDSTDREQLLLSLGLSSGRLAIKRQGSEFHSKWSARLDCIRAQHILALEQMEAQHRREVTRLRALLAGAREETASLEAVVEAMQADASVADRLEEALSLAYSGVVGDDGEDGEDEGLT